MKKQTHRTRRTNRKIRKTKRKSKRSQQGGTCGACMLQSGAGVSPSRPAAIPRNNKNKRNMVPDPQHEAMIALERAIEQSNVEEVDRILDEHPELHNGMFGMFLPRPPQGEIADILERYRFYEDNDE